MKTFIRKAGTIVSCRNQNPASNIQGLRSSARMGAILLPLAFLSIHLSGQNPVQLPLSEFDHGTRFVGMAGDTMKFEFDLGSPQQPATHVLGHDIVASFPSLTATPSQVLVHVAGTWIAANGGNADVSVDFDSEQRRLEMAYLRTDAAGQDGAGCVARIFLVRSGGFTSAEAVMKSDGGLIIADNVDLRLSQPMQVPAAAPGPDLLPFQVQLHPGLDQLDLYIPQPEGCQIRLTGMNGTVVCNLPARLSQQIDLQGIPGGVYIITLHTGTQRISRKIFIH